MKQNTSIIILAAGLGKRMFSDLPKVLHQVCGKPLLLLILDKINKNAAGMVAGGQKVQVAIVVGHGRDQVISQVQAYLAQCSHLDIEFIVQDKQKGTGHAARCVMDSDWGQRKVKSKDNILVLPGDLPLINENLIHFMSEPYQESVHLLSTLLLDPTGYGRIIRKNKKAHAIVEEKDATLAQKKIKEVGVSIYSFKADYLAKSLQKLKNKNAQSEYYLTDVIGFAAKENKKIKASIWSESEDLRGINDLFELAEAQKILNQRIIKNWQKQGVRVEDPGSCWIDLDVKLSKGVQIEQGVILKGSCQIGERAKIGAHSVLTHAAISDDVTVQTGCVIENSVIKNKATIGPYARLRPESIVAEEAKIGNFVELKKTKIGYKTSVAHLSYLGDAEVGSHVNIGCGFVTCNFDGRVINGSRKHKTVIEDHVFVGSDCQAVAPIIIKRGSFIASGSTITQNVDEDSLAIARSRQVTKIGRAKKYRSEKE